MKKIRILGLHITDRIKEAGQTQKTLSENHTLIKTRLGFHEVSEDVCSRTGIILLQLSGSVDEQDKLEHQLREIRGIDVQRMEFGE
ncbi:MAG: hypothetical protein Q7J34_01400 [Bacteroidales bacterium]|jgi:hypothetical protein|nr:hypothetical protein [Bacteroidales bacterium]